MASEERDEAGGCSGASTSKRATQRLRGPSPDAIQHLSPLALFTCSRLEIQHIRTDSGYPPVVRVLQFKPRENLSDDARNESFSKTRCLETINVAGAAGVERDSTGVACGRR